MNRILPGIHSLKQHLNQLKQDPEVYRPIRCPHCGKGDLWSHGHYLRKADREGKDGVYLDPVPILRYYCSGCRRSCSRLPSCIAPRRWYLWAIQQVVLELVLGGAAFRKAAREHPPGRRTISRWWHRLHEQFTDYNFHLRSRFPELGHHDSPEAFWSACLHQMPLVNAMAVLDQQAVIVP
ncbi:MAG: DUF6431 domain-containing protein [Sedimenticola sp.]